MAIDGDAIVVGAPGDDDGGSGSGSAYVFTRQSGVWNQAKLTASDAYVNDEFGYSVAIDGDTIVVGARYDDDKGAFSGSAYVFAKPAGGWATATQTAKLTAAGGSALDLFGYSVAVDGDTIVVGALGFDGVFTLDSGAAYVFEKPSGGWATGTQTAKLTAVGAAGDDVFGEAVAISGDTIVVGVAGDDDGGSGSGSAIVFTKPASGWATMTSSIKLTAKDAAIGDAFGDAVAVEGDTIVVGARETMTARLRRARRMCSPSPRTVGRR